MTTRGSASLLQVDTYLVDIIHDDTTPRKLHASSDQSILRLYLLAISSVKKLLDFGLYLYHDLVLHFQDAQSRTKRH